MKNNSSTQKKNTPRIVLYLVTVFVCMAFIYVHKYITPKLNTQVKEKTLTKIQTLYSQQKYEMALQACQAYIANYPREAQVLAWMGMCLDGVAIQLEFQKQELLNIEERLKDKHLTPDRVAMLQAQRTSLEKQIQKWQDEDFEKRSNEIFRKAIKYAGPNQTQIAVMITQSYLAKKNFSAVTDILQNIETNTPLSLAQKAIVELQLHYAQGEDQANFVPTLREKAADAIQKFEALSELEKNKMSLPTYIPYWAMAKLYHLENNYSKANEFYGKACEIDTVLHVYNDWLSVAEKENNPHQLIPILQTIEEMAPSVDVKYKLAKANMLIWNIKASWEYLEEALYLSTFQGSEDIYHRVAKDSVWQKCYDQPQFQLMLGWEKLADIDLQKKLREAIHMTFEKRFDGALHYIKEIEQKDANIYQNKLLKLYVIQQQRAYYETWAQQVSRNEKLIASEISPEQKEQLEKENSGVNEKMQQLKSHLASKEDIDLLEERIKEMRPNMEMALANTYFQAYGIVRGLDVALRQELVQKAKELLESVDPDSLSTQERGFAEYVFFSYYKQQQNSEKALESLEKTIEYDIANPGYSMVYLQELTNLSDENKEKKNKMVAIAQKVAPHIEGMPIYQSNVGSKLIEVEEYQAARKFFQKTLAVKPNSSISLFFIATTYLHEKDEPAALLFLQQALQGDDPTFIPKMLEYYEIWKTMEGKPKYLEILQENS